MIKIIVGFIFSFLVSLILMPLIIKLICKLSCSQTILKYVEEHKSKQGTPTMGGVVFYISTLIVVVCLMKYSTELAMCVGVGLGFALIGLMDDYIKVKYKQNLGLKPYQKIVGQLGISVIFAMFVFFSQNAGNIFALFSTKSIDLKFFVIPLIILVLIACSNSVNLTDGLDGLAGNVSLFYLIFFTLISIVISTKLYNAGETGQILTQIESINTLNMLFIGSILAFLMFNTNKASIFMGDVGSLCLGGYIGASACVLGLELILPILGFCFVFSAISVIMQVIYFKLTKKRIFKMAPFHHHLQLSNLSEPKIVAIYSAVTSVLGVICLIFYLL